MEADPSFQCTEAMRIASRDGFFLVFATDSITTPEKIAFCGKTMPFTNVATASLASILDPTAVFPVSKLCCRITGNCNTDGGMEAAGFC